MAVQFPEYLDFIRLSDERALLVGPATTKELRGESVDLVEQALPLLSDGTTTGELADNINISESLADDLISQLQRASVLKVEAESHGYWSWAGPALGVDGDAVQETRVAVLDQSGCNLSDSEEYPFSIISFDSINELLPELNDVDLLLTITVGENQEFHQAITQRISENPVDWIPARLTGSIVTFGPFGTATTQGCYNCYDQRRRASTDLASSVVESIEQRPNQDRTPYTEYIHGFLVHILLTEAVAALGNGKTPRSNGAVVECDLIQFTMNRREILPIPGCELCGTS